MSLETAKQIQKVVCKQEYLILCLIIKIEITISTQRVGVAISSIKKENSVKSETACMDCIIFFLL